MDLVDLFRPLAMIIGLLNMGLLLGLLIIYIKSYRDIRSDFTLGLIIFATLMFLQKIGNIMFIFRYSEYHAPRMGMSVFVLSFIELCAYSALLWISIR